MGDGAVCNRRMGQGRGDRGRYRYRRVILANDGGAQGARPVLYRRGGGRDRMAGRVQFSVGVVEWMVRGSIGLAASVSEKNPLANCNYLAGYWAEVRSFVSLHLDWGC